MPISLNTDITPGTFTLTQPAPTGTEVLIRAYLQPMSTSQRQTLTNLNHMKIRQHLQDYLENQTHDWKYNALTELGRYKNDKLDALFKAVLEEFRTGNPINRLALFKNR